MISQGNILFLVTFSYPLLCDQKQSCVVQLWAYQRIHLGHVAAEPAERYTNYFMKFITLNLKIDSILTRASSTLQ
jgi:hypothetical protein